MEDKGTVLVVEDTTNWQELLTEELVSKGYHVELAASYDEAMGKLRKRLPLVAIIDYCLSKTDPTNTDGESVLEEIAKLNEGTTRIIVSGHATLELARTAYRQHGAFNVLQKESFDTQEYLRIVESGVEAARKETRASRSSEAALRDAYENSRSELDDFQRVQVLDLMREHGFVEEVFAGLPPITFGRITTTGTTKSGIGGLVVRVHGWSRGLGKSIVIAIGPRQLVERENENHDKYLGEPQLSEGKVGTQKLRFVQSDHQGGVVYCLEGASHRAIPTLAEYFRSEETDAVLLALDDLFLHRYPTLYHGNSETQAEADLSDMYGEPFREERIRQEKQEELEEAEEQQYLAQMDEEDRILYLQEKQKDLEERRTPSFRLYGLKRTFVDPLCSIRDMSFRFRTFLRVAHGDLGPENALVGQDSTTWLIGFGRTGENHYLYDFVRLETGLRFQLLQSRDARALYEFESALVSQKRFDEDPAFADSYRVPELARAFSAVVRVRQLAWKVARPPTSDMKEYYASLLLQTVNLLQYAHLRPGIEDHARLSAAVIAERLSAWS